MNYLNKRTLIFLCLIGVGLFSSLSSIGQTKNEIQFYKYHLTEYMKPVMVAPNKYQAYFENMGETREQGRVILDEKAKTFIIKWLDGEEWNAKFTTKESKSEYDISLGDVTRTTYSGKWTDEDVNCSLIVITTKSQGCVLVLKTRKVIDKDYGINVWKKSLIFGTRGECFN